MTTKQIDDGGPAFPNVWEDNPSQGMSLRDHFAGLAMQVLSADPESRAGYEGLPSKRVSARRP